MRGRKAKGAGVRMRRNLRGQTGKRTKATDIQVCFCDPHGVAKAWLVDNAENKTG